MQQRCDVNKKNNTRGFQENDGPIPFPVHTMNPSTSADGISEIPERKNTEEEPVEEADADVAEESSPINFRLIYNYLSKMKKLETEEQQRKKNQEDIEKAKNLHEDVTPISPNEKSSENASELKPNEPSGSKHNENADAESSDAKKKKRI